MRARLIIVVRRDRICCLQTEFQIRYCFITDFIDVVNGVCLEEEKQKYQILAERLNMIYYNPFYSTVLGSSTYNINLYINSLTSVSLRFIMLCVYLFW